MVKNRDLEETIEINSLDLESWLIIHYPKVLIEYRKLQENLIKE